MTDAVVELLAAQHGLIAWSQLRLLEPDRGRRRSIAADASLASLTARVLRSRSAPVTYEQRLMAACLDAGGGLIWGKSAARLWGFGRFRPSPVHVAVTRRRLHGDFLGQVHVIKRLDPRDRTYHLDIPVATPESTILWLAGMWTHCLPEHGMAAQRTGVALDQAWRQRLIDGRALHELCRWSGGRGRSGIVVLRTLLEERPADYQPSGSALEDRFEALLPPSLQGRLRRQVRVGDERGPIGVADFADDCSPLVVEVNGEAFHSSVIDRAADEARYRAMVTAGFTVVVVWEHDIWYEGWRVTAALADIARRPLVPGVIRPTPAPWD